MTRFSETVLAERLGTSQPTVNRILNGKADCKAATLLAIQKWHRELKGDSDKPHAAAEPQREGV